MNGSWTNWKVSPSPSEKNLPLPTTMSVEKRNVRKAETSEFAVTFASFRFFE